MNETIMQERFFGRKENPVNDTATTKTKPMQHQEQPNEDYFECINDYLDGTMGV